MTLSTCRLKLYSTTIYLYDAVYLYLRTINQTFAEGYTNYRDGRFIRNRTIGQRFVGGLKLNRLSSQHFRTSCTVLFTVFCAIIIFL